MYKSCCVVLYSSISIALLTARVFQDRSQPQHLTHCRSLHAEALQATVSEGLAQGPYVVARAGFKPTTLRLKGIDSTNVPSRPTYYTYAVCISFCIFVCMSVSLCSSLYLCISLSSTHAYAVMLTAFFWVGYLCLGLTQLGLDLKTSFAHYGSIDIILCKGCNI